MKAAWVRTAVLAVGVLVCAAEAAAQSPFFVPPTYAGSGQTVTADFNGDGKADLASSDGTVLLGNGDGTFTAAASLSVTGNSIAVGDFNGDGKADVIITSNATTVMSVLLGNGNGTFQAALTVNVGAGLKSLVVADFNGDGKLDVAGVNDTSGLFVLLSNGSGSFTAASGSPLTLAASSLIIAGDFNGDGKTDIAFGSSSNTVVPGGVFLGNGDGTFTTGSALTIGLQAISAVGAADLTGTGKQDLVFSGSTSSGAPQTVVLVGHGDGTFQSNGASLAANGALAIADVNGDHKPDVILDDDNVTRVFIGIGDGTLTLENTYLQDSALKSSRSVVAADFNGDGKTDIATKNLILLGNGDGSLRGDDASVFVGAGVTGGVVGDFNGDGSLDVVTSDGSNVRVLLNDGTGKFIQAHSYASSAVPIAAGDLNHDGKLDVVLTTTRDNNQTFALDVMFGNGDGTFGAAQSTGVSGLTGSSLAIRLVDLNGDNFADLVVLTAQGANVYLGKGDGTFQAPVNYFAGATPTSMQLGDFSGDGKLDVAVGSAAGIGVLPGNGDGTFGTVVLSGTGPISIAATGDVNGDSKLDLIGMGSSLNVYLGNGNGTFQAPLSTGTPGPANGFASITTADVDGDGKLDVVAGTGVWFVKGNGDGTFQTPISISPGGSFAVGPFVDAVADFNSDGSPDVLITTATMQLEQGFATFLNASGSTAANFTVAATAAFPESVEAGSSATSTVTVTNLNGFSANVALSCLGLPAGASCVFAPATSGAGAVLSTLTISVGTTTASGTYYVSVVGAGGGLTRSRLLTLTVTPGNPDFVVSPGSGGTSTVAAGKPATYSLSIGGSGGFSGNVGLTCSGAPAAATCTISPTSVMVAGGTAATATVTVTTTARSEILPTAIRDRADRWTPWPGIYGSQRLVAIYAAGSASVIGLLVIFGMRPRRRMSWATVAGGVLLLAGLTLSGCGGGSAGSGPIPVVGTPAGNYTITVTATAGSGANAVSHTTKLTLVVQ